MTHHSEPNILVVAYTRDWYRLRRQYPNAKFVAPGGAICGYGANWIVIDDPCLDPPPPGNSVMRGKLMEWFDSAVACRLMRGGKVYVRREDDALEEVQTDNSLALSDLVRA